MKKRNIYQNRSQELLSLFKEARNSAKVMAETGSMKFWKNRPGPEQEACCLN